MIPWKLVGVMVLVLFLLPVVVSADMFEPIGNKPALIDDTPLQIEYKPIDFSKDIIEAIGTFLGLIDKGIPPVAVMSEDTMLAVIPPNSKFVDMDVHGYCVGQFQYGTDFWVQCEKGYV